MNDKAQQTNNILFVLETLGTGGTTTSMCNLLMLMAEKHDCHADVLLFHKDGSSVKQYEDKLHILEEDVVLWFLATNKRKALRRRPFVSVLLLVVYQILAWVMGGREKAKCVLYAWRAQRYSNIYYTVVAYQEANITLFCSKIKAQNKVAWVHCDCELLLKLHNIGAVSQSYFTFNHIVCVSEATRQRFIKNLPQFADKTSVIYNLFRPQTILAKSKEYTIDRRGKRFVLLSIGRVSFEKRFDKIVNVAKKLLADGHDFIWYIVGDGLKFSEIKYGIQINELEETIILTGALQNPFPYTKEADFLVITSDYEAHPMVANEALILSTPVISTALPSIGEIIIDGENGIIAGGMEADDMYQAIHKVFQNEVLYAKLKDGAKQMRYDNDAILKKVMGLISEDFD